VSDIGRKMAIALAEATCEAGRRQFERGDKAALLRTIFECARVKMLLPDWCAEAFMRAVAETKSDLRAGASWDDAFGKPHRKHRKVRAKGQEEKLRWRVYHAVQREQAGFSLEEVVRARRQGLAAVQKLKKNKKRKIPLYVAFACVAKRFKLTESVCKKYYYSALEAKNKPPGPVVATVKLTATGDVVTNFAK
jgi:hypothetical protein